MKERLMKNNRGLKILAFLIATLLWLIVVNIDDPIMQETYIEVPVTVINTEVLAAESQTFQIVDDTHNVDVTVTAKRSVLNKIRKEDIVAVADMRELTLKTQIPIDVTVEGYNYESAVASPRNLQVILEDEETKKFPIVPTTTGTVRDGYALGEIEAVPEKVSIRGPKSVIDLISRVEAEVNVSGLSEDKILPSELILYDKENNVIDQKLLANNLGDDGVSVSVQLLPVKNVPIKFDTSGVIAEAGYNFIGITFEPSEVQLLGEKEVLDQLSAIQIPASALQIEGLNKRKEVVVDISGYLPANVQLVDENAGSIIVMLNVEKDGSKKFDFTVASIQVDNLSSKLQLTYTTVDAIEIELRGPKAELEIFDVDSSVSIDLEEYKAEGDFKVPVKIKVPDGCFQEQEVYVSINLKKKE